MAHSHSKTLKNILSERKTISLIIAVAVVLAVAFATVCFAYPFIRNVTAEGTLSHLEKMWDKNSVSNSFALLKAENPDISAWLTVENTDINYPVLKSDIKGYYKNHDSLGHRNSLGAIRFSDEYISCGKESPQNICIEGALTENGILFGELAKARMQDFVKSKPKITLYTEKGTKNYLIFSVAVLNEDSREMKYLRMPELEDFAVYKFYVTNKSIFSSPVRINGKSSILTLITETYGEKGAKLAVSAVAVTDKDYYNADAAEYKVKR